jgi:hypothetical protein
MRALPSIATREGDRPRSPGYRASRKTFAARNRMARRNARPPIHRHAGGRPSSVAGMSRIAKDLRRTQPCGAQECAPSHPSPHGRATVLGRRDIAHRKRPSPHATDRRSGTTALPFTATREGDRPRSPGCRASPNTFASCNHSAVGDDRPPIHRHTGGRPSSVAGISRIAKDLRRTQPHGAQECAPSHPLPHGRATVLGRRDIAHRKRPSPHATDRRSGTTALPIPAHCPPSYPQTHPYFRLLKVKEPRYEQHRYVRARDG